MNWDHVRNVTGAMMEIAVVLGALGATVRLRLFNVLGTRWRSDVTCRHWVLPDRSIVLAAEFHVPNTGLRPLHISSVTPCLLGSRHDGRLVLPDGNSIVAERRHQPSAGDAAFMRLCSIQPGERSIFTLRMTLDSLDEITFIDPSFSRDGDTAEGNVTAMYVASARAVSPTSPSGTSTPSAES